MKGKKFKNPDAPRIATILDTYTQKEKYPDGDFCNPNAQLIKYETDMGVFELQSDLFFDDYSEEVKVNKYIQITNEGSRCLQTIEDARTFIESIEEGEVYVFRAAYMTESEFENLPEFTGF